MCPPRRCTLPALAQIELLRDRQCRFFVRHYVRCVAERKTIAFFRYRRPFDRHFGGDFRDTEHTSLDSCRFARIERYQRCCVAQCQLGFDDNSSFPDALRFDRTAAIFDHIERCDSDIVSKRLPLSQSDAIELAAARYLLWCGAGAENKSRCEGKE